MNTATYEELNQEAETVWESIKAISYSKGKRLIDPKKADENLQGLYKRLHAISTQISLLG